MDTRQKRRIGPTPLSPQQLRTVRKQLASVPRLDKEYRRRKAAARKRGEVLFPEAEDVLKEARAKGLSSEGQFDHLATRLRDFMELHGGVDGLADEAVRFGLRFLREVVIQSPARDQRKRARAHLNKALSGLLPKSFRVGGKPRSRFSHDYPRESARLLAGLKAAPRKRNVDLQAQEIAKECEVALADAKDVVRLFRAKRIADAAYVLLAQRYGRQDSYVRRVTCP